MRICMDHWQQLRTAIEDRGLTPFVSKNGEEAARRTANISNGSEDPQDFDPLIAANMAIISYYISQVGIDGLTQDVCPICTAAAEADGDELPNNWINGAADDVLAVAKDKKLVLTQ